MAAGEPNSTENAAFAPWSFCAQPAGTITHPDQLHDVQTRWMVTGVPGTAAVAVHARGACDLSRPPDLDAEDW